MTQVTGLVGRFYSPLAAMYKHRGLNTSYWSGHRAAQVTGIGPCEADTGIWLLDAGVFRCGTFTPDYECFITLSAAVLF